MYSYRHGGDDADDDDSCSDGMDDGMTTGDMQDIDLGALPAAVTQHVALLTLRPASGWGQEAHRTERGAGVEGY